ncbi:MAG: hypothetical protein H6R30_605 [Methanomicrobia archaeon]|nr:hypothetical protein [Methanomicrobia archaeon]
MVIPPQCILLIIGGASPLRISVPLSGNHPCRKRQGAPARGILRGDGLCSVPSEVLGGLQLPLDLHLQLGEGGLPLGVGVVLVDGLLVGLLDGDHCVGGEV